MAHARLATNTHAVCTLKRLVWTLLLVVPLGTFAAEVYRSVDEKGIVVYSDRPSIDSTVVVIRTPGSSSRSRPQSPAAGNPEASEGNADDSPVVAEIPREPTPDEVAADRKRNCNFARQKLEAYSTARRLYRNGPDGEREYLSDEEIDKERAQAESDVAEWCD
jgi:hypothetical protein